MEGSSQDNIMWPDWKDRQTELLDKAGFFDFMKRPATAEWLRLLAEKVGSQSSRGMLKKYLNETLAAWNSDFAGNDELRKSRLEAVSRILLSSVATGKFNDEMQTILPLMRELEKNLDNLMPLGIAFAPFRIRGDHKMRFYGMCYYYPLFVEGVFDDSIRLLFLLVSSSKGRSIPLAKINKMSLKDLREKFQGFGFADIFFQGWENRVRNSIAHARFRYDEKLGMMHFVDIDPWGKLPDYSKWFTLEEFSQLGTQLSDIYAIIQDVIFMLRIQQLVLSPEVPKVANSLLMPSIQKGVAEGILKDPNR